MVSSILDSKKYESKKKFSNLHTAYNYNIATTNYIYRKYLPQLSKPLFRTLRCDKTIPRLLKTDKYLEKESKKQQIPHILHALALLKTLIVIIYIEQNQDRK